ncbi:MAG: metallophosphoesterase [Verrucomicrobiales bacterium]|nr:metallophosphoesterase [Verrucomicrobiales bacterium]
MNFSRRKWLARAAVYGTGVGATSYAGVIEKRWLDVTHTEIPLAPKHSVLAGIKIAVVGDFHHDDFGDHDLIRRAVNAINEEKVDLVYLVGDYISRHATAVVPLCEELVNLRSTLGTFGVMGNHDSRHDPSFILATLKEIGVRMLVNGTHEFEHFTLAGMASCSRGIPVLPKILTGLDPDKPVIMGWHEPDTFDLYSDPRIVLQVSGHTHGGQIRAPFYGPLVLPKFGRTYPYGLYQNESSALFVTRGIGTLTLPIRFLCPPEVAILKFTLPRESL